MRKAHRKESPTDPEERERRRQALEELERQIKEWALGLQKGKSALLGTKR